MFTFPFNNKFDCLFISNFPFQILMNLYFVFFPKSYNRMVSHQHKKACFSKGHRKMITTNCANWFFDVVVCAPNVGIESAVSFIVFHVDIDNYCCHQVKFE